MGDIDEFVAETEDSADEGRMNASEQWLEVEVFRLATGRLPDKPDDRLTEAMCKVVMDQAILQLDPAAEKVVHYAAHRWWLLRHPQHHCDEKCRTHK